MLGKPPDGCVENKIKSPNNILQCTSTAFSSLVHISKSSPVNVNKISLHGIRLRVTTNLLLMNAMITFENNPKFLLQFSLGNCFT